MRSAPPSSSDSTFTFETVVPPISTEAAPSSGPPSPKVKASERRGSVRRRKRGFGHGVTSPTENMPWFDKIGNTTLLLRNLIDRDPRGSSELSESLAAVITTRSTALQRLLVITNIAPTLSKKEAVDAIKKACRPSGGIHDNQVYIPEVESRVTAEVPRREDGSGDVDSRVRAMTELLPSALQDKPEKILGYAVVQLKSASQLELVRQAITSSKTLKDPLSAEFGVGVARVNSELLMEGTNELVAFAVFDEFLNARMFNGESVRTLSESAKGALVEVFSSCARASHVDVKDIKSDDCKTAQANVDSESTDRSMQAKEYMTEEVKPPAEPHPREDSLEDTETCTRSDTDPKTTLGKVDSSALSQSLLTKDQICSLLPGNLLLSFFNAVRHAKESTSELVTQLLREHGSAVEMSDERVLGLGGFLNWVLIRGSQDVRAIWKGVIACGYDLKFDR